MPQRWRGTMQSRPGTNLRRNDLHVRRARCYASGLGVTPHPRMGAVEELKVTLRELAENRRLIEKLA